MATATFTVPLASYVSNFSRAADQFIGSLISVKPSVIASSFAAAYAVSHVISENDIGPVSAETVRQVRKIMGLDAV
jgi:hypothetical protein